MTTRIIFLMGPTAAGKTDMAVELVARGPYEIISVDSAMIYRGMNIGTGKPDNQTLQMAPHHLIDICEPNEIYSAAQFRSDAIKLIDDIIDRGKIPLLVGGTMLYFKALKQGIAALPDADPKLRSELTHKVKTQGLDALHKQLHQVDPESAERIHPNDPQRIIRALEVFELTKIPLSKHLHEAAQEALPYPTLDLAFAPVSRAQLHSRIEARLDAMLQQGFVEEVTNILQHYPNSTDLPAMRSVGYRQIVDYLEGKINYDEMRSKALYATRQLAKRQLTWLRSWPDVHWCHDKNQIFHQLDLA